MTSNTHRLAGRIRMALGATALGAITATTLAAPAAAQEKYLGEIFMTASNFCPRGSAPADGTLLGINKNTALFSLLGTTYGGDGLTTFALPDLRGRSPVHQGKGPGLSEIKPGSRGGQEEVTLDGRQVPSHGELAVVENQASAVTVASGNDVKLGYKEGGGAQPIAIRDPYLAVKMCVVMQGIYPSRN
ncbi:phage tail protein [Henriciella litoralis]|uniref:phage tail protein n=1 Tax=Henriciella litoralis TaxID=568102 RepID=UPI001F165639|nr:tail fiber protein [Henriciella litoralis]